VTALLRDRRVEPQVIGPGGIPLPTHTDDRKSLAQQPRIAGIATQVGIATIDESNDVRHTAIGDLQQQGAIALVGILGPQSDEIGGEFDFAMAQVDRVAQVDDAGVMGIIDRDGVIDIAADPLVGAGVTEGFAVKDLGAGFDLDPGDARLERRGRLTWRALNVT
jgi:hypothetical protein